MTNYFKNMNEKMADWFMLFFTDDDYAVQVPVVGSDIEYTTVAKETAADFFDDISINLSFLTDLKLKITELAVIAGNALVSFINEIPELTKGLTNLYRPDAVLLKVNEDVMVVKEKITKVKSSSTKKITVTLKTAGKVFKAGTVVVKLFLRNLHGIAALRISKMAQYFTGSPMRNMILEWHTT